MSIITGVRVCTLACVHQSVPRGYITWFVTSRDKIAALFTLPRPAAAAAKKSCAVHYILANFVTVYINGKFC